MLWLEGKGVNAIVEAADWCYTCMWDQDLYGDSTNDHRAAKGSIVRFPTKTMPTTLPIAAIFSCLIRPNSTYPPQLEDEAT